MRRLLCALTRHRQRHRTFETAKLLQTSSGMWWVTGESVCRCGRERDYEGHPTTPR